MTIAIITEAGVRKVAPLVSLAQQAAAIASNAANVAVAAAEGRIYPDYATGNAATTAGQYFFVASGGAYDLYVHGTATPVAKLPTLDASTGYLGVGTAPACRLHVKSTGEVSRLETTSPRGNGSNYIGFYDSIGQAAFAGYGGNSNDFYVFNNIDGRILFGTNGAERIQITSVGHLHPSSDNASNLGAASFRFGTVYAVTGAINTSDAEEKQWLGAGFSPAELAAAKRISAEIGTHRWLASIAEKGEGARTHIGVRAQAIWAIMADEGLIDPVTEGIEPDSRYAFLCWDKWDAAPATEEVLNDEGEVVVAAQPARSAGQRFGIRPDQLALFLIAAQEARLTALEA